MNIKVAAFTVSEKSSNLFLIKDIMQLTQKNAQWSKSNAFQTFKI